MDIELANIAKGQTPKTIKTNNHALNALVYQDGEKNKSYFN